MDESFLDLLYEAAAVPELWPNVLDQLAVFAGGVGTFLITADPKTIRWTSSESLRTLGLEILEGHWHERNPRMERLVLHKQSGFLREIDMFTIEEMEVEPTFRDLLRPRGFGWAVGTILQVPSDDMLLFSTERRFVDGPVPQKVVDQLNDLRPDLARAALLSARLGLTKAAGMAESLSKMGLPSAVLLADGRIIAASTEFEKMGSQIIATAFGKIAFANVAANRLLRQALQCLNSKEFTGARSIPVPSDATHAAFVAHLLPIRRSAHEVFGAALGILVITPLVSSTTIPEDVLNGLFDLSPAEIRAVNGLLAGKTIANLATELNLSTETIRSQVKAVLLKTGTNRQSELISLLANVRTPV